VHHIQMKKPQVERPGAFLWMEYCDCDSAADRLYHAQASIFLMINLQAIKSAPLDDSR
jgi:hypothetical protein